MFLFVYININMEKQELKVGDLFHRSWGYDMTFNDFWQVVKVKSPCTIVVRPIGSEVVEWYDGWSGRERPVKDKFIGWEETYRVGKSGWIKVNDYDHAWKSKWEQDWYFNRLD